MNWAWSVFVEMSVEKTTKINSFLQFQSVLKVFQVFYAVVVFKCFEVFFEWESATGFSKTTFSDILFGQSSLKQSLCRIEPSLILFSSVLLLFSAHICNMKGEPYTQGWNLTFFCFCQLIMSDLTLLPCYEFEFFSAKWLQVCRRMRLKL